MYYFYVQLFRFDFGKEYSNQPDKLEFASIILHFLHFYMKSKYDLVQTILMQ